MDFHKTSHPIENEYPKLVRDRIVEIIQRRGGNPKWETIASDEEYLKQLLRKLSEELFELQHAASEDNFKEEVCDLLEIIQTVIKAKGWSVEEIARVQLEKREKNGGFDKRVLLVENE